MFISNTERIQFKTSIETLGKIIGDLNAELLYLKAKVKVLEGKTATPKKKMTEAQRAKQREYAKRYKAKKQLEKQNATSISTTSV